jgi:hypothetical protein
MSKIRSVIQINSGYTSYVDLSREFFYYDEEQNRGRMERYMPIKAHRIAFEKIANVLNPKDRRFYFLSGSYGTGKSHLCLMIGNYFAKQSNSLEMETFFNNYAISQKEVLLKPGETLDEKPASSLSAQRKEGKFLVAICRYGLNLEFEGLILRAIEEALEKEGASVKLDTHYKEALRKIRDWEEKKADKRFFNDFETELSRNYPDWTSSKLRKGLEKVDEKSLKVFKHIHKEITDTEFTFSKDNLQDILIDIITNDKFKKTYKGIVIVYDEFGYALDGGLVNLNRLHEFAQFCANSGLKYLPVAFIGTGHKMFPKHGQVGDAVYYDTLKDRVTEIALQTEGMEDLISAVVQQKKSDPIWINEVTPHTDTFAQLPVECKRLRIFTWLPAPKLKNNIIENIYPMHPFATYALLQMAKDLGSDNRSVFKFFAPEFETGADSWKNVQSYSYPWFIEDNEILKNGQLMLYTADLLIDYFKDSISGENRKLIRHERIRTSIVNYEATIRELNNYILSEKETKLFSEIDEVLQKILKAMLVNEIVSTEDVPIINTIENIGFALNTLTLPDRKTVEGRLDVLCKAGILYKNENHVYEFRRSDIKDVTRMVNEFKINPENHPDNVLNKFLEFAPLKSDERFFEAKDFNVTYNEDKRLLAKFIMPSELDQSFTIEGNICTFFDKLEIDRKKTDYGKDSFEGTALYVFCETDEAIEQAKKVLSKNTQTRVVVGTPKKGIGLLDNVLSVMAIDGIQKSDEAKNFGPYENSQLVTIRKTNMDKLNELKGDYFNNKHMDWFGVKGAALPVQETKRYDVANNVMINLFNGKRNMVSHQEFNKVHIKNDGTVRRIMLEAGDLLINLTETVMIDWTHPENRGGTKYLRKCFVDQQILKLIRTEGDMRFFEVERDVNKLKTVYQVYARMLSDLKSIEGKGSRICKSFLEPYFEEYGQGEIAITLFLLLARRFYGDSLRFKREEHALTDIYLDSTEKILDIVVGKDLNAVLFVEPISEEEKSYFTQICQIFIDGGIEAGRHYGINDAYKAITSWWKKLPIIARSESFYDKDFKPYVSALNKADTTDPFVFVKHAILGLFGISQDEKISAEQIRTIKEKMEQFKIVASEILNNQEQKLLKEISIVFSAEGFLDVDIMNAMKSWHDGLDSYQKDQHGSYHNNESKTIISKISKLSEIRELLFKAYPEVFGFKSVSDWVIDNTKGYIDKIKSGKAHIEDNKSPVGDAVVAFMNNVQKDGSKVMYKGKVSFNIITEKREDFVYYTDDGSDPTDEKSNRKKVDKGDLLQVNDGNRTIKYVVCDKEKNYGKICTLNIIDETKKHEIKKPGQLLKDVSVTFVFPNDKEGARKTLMSLCRELLEAKVITVQELEAIVDETVHAIKSK